MAWEVEFTNEFEGWFETLDASTENAVVLAVRVLQSRGPALGRPLVENVHSSRFANMKELRPLSSNTRVLFAFDPRRTAILLIGGDKSGKWNKWYLEIVPIADRLFEEYLEELRQEGLLP